MPGQGKCLLVIGKQGVKHGGAGPSGSVPGGVAFSQAAASQFPLAHPVVTAIIPGTRQPDRVTENFDLLKVEIPGEFWADLRTDGLIREEAPIPE